MRRLIAMLMLSALLCCGIFPAGAEDRVELTDAQLLSYYRNSVFVGDSITAQLLVYVREQQQKDPSFFEGVKFLTAQSYSLYAASRKYPLDSAVNLKYRGREMSLCAILKDMKPARVIILLGVNDYIGEKIQKGIGFDERILDLTAEYSPGTQVIFESLTPVTPAFCRKKNYQALWDQYNVALEQMCEERGAGYIDIASGLKDEKGYLNAAYTNDGKYHLNDAGLKIWIDALIDYARTQYELGLWAPED